MQKGGTYIDLAAYHPRKHSNTYMLDVCYGWKGICIEADPAKANLYKLTRFCSDGDDTVACFSNTYYPMNQFPGC
jgi:hypothetical protein